MAFQRTKFDSFPISYLEDFEKHSGSCLAMSQGLLGAISGRSEQWLEILAIVMNRWRLTRVEGFAAAEMDVFLLCLKAGEN